MTGQRTERAREKCPSLCSARIFRFSTKPTWLWGPPTFLTIGKGGLFPAGRLAGPCSRKHISNWCEIKNSCSCIYTVPYVSKKWCNVKGQLYISPIIHKQFSLSVKIRILTLLVTWISSSYRLLWVYSWCSSRYSSSHTEPNTIKQVKVPSYFLITIYYLVSNAVKVI